MKDSTQPMKSTSPIRWIEIARYYPKENRATIIMTTETGRVLIKDDKGEPIRYPMVYRGDESEGKAIQPGDRGFILFSGSQMTKGFIFIGFSEGGDEAALFSPIRGRWGV